MARASGEGSIFFDEHKGRWVAQVEAGYGPGGTRRRMKRLAETRKKAVEKLRALQREVAAGAVGVPDEARQTVETYLSWWLDVREGTVRPSTWQSYRLRCRHVADRIGHVKLTALNAQHVVGLMATMRDEGYAPATIANTRTVLSMALNYAVRLQLVPRNVAADTDGPKIERNPYRDLDTTEAAALLAETADEPMFGTLVATLAFTGLRIGEACGLRWSDIDLEDGWAKLEVQLRWTSGGFELPALKTKQSRRGVELPDGLVERLRAWKRTQAELRLAAERWRDGGHGLVFTREDGYPVRNTTEIVKLKRRAAEAGIDDPESVTFHGLRHTFGTLLSDGGVDLKHISDMMGHSSIQVTADLYTHPRRTVRREAAEGLADRLEGHEKFNRDAR